MASAAGESGAGGGDRCPSGEKGTTQVGRVDTYLQKKGILSPRLHRPNYL